MSFGMIVRLGWVAACLSGGLSLAQADTLRVGGSGSATSLVRVLADAFARKTPGDTVAVGPVLGTAGGIKALQAKAFDLALTSRPLNEAEVKGGLLATEFARTPFVIAVAASNALNDISASHLAKLYGSPSAVWPDGTRVRVVLRPMGDTDTLLLKKISPEVAAAIDAALARPGVHIAATDEDAIAAIQRLPGAIGSTTLAQILADKRPLKALAIDGRKPEVAFIRDGSYAYYKRQFFLTDGNPSLAARRFIDFTRSAEGRRLLETLGCWADFPDR